MNFSILADARQRWADDALDRLIENFADPKIGAVSGDLVLESARASWRASGSTGASRNGCANRKAGSARKSASPGPSAPSAVRSFLPIPPGTLLDDVFGRCTSSCKVIASSMTSGRKRSIGCRNCRATSFAARCARLAGNFQLLTLLPAAGPVPVVATASGGNGSRTSCCGSPCRGRCSACWYRAFFLTEEFYQIFLWVQVGGYAARPARPDRGAGRHGCGCWARQRRSWCSMPPPGSPSGSGSRAERGSRGTRCSTRSRRRMCDARLFRFFICEGDCRG